MTDTSGQPWPIRSQDYETPRRNPVTVWLVASIAVSAALGFFSAEIGNAFENSRFGHRTIVVVNRVSADIQRRITGKTPAQMQADASDRDILTASLRTTAREFPVCGSGKRLNCVVDGDTFWFNGEKIRIASIDAPELRGQCRQEKKLAERATQRLSEILSRQAFTVQRSGLDRYGRTLASIEGSSGEAGAILVHEGLARPWSGRKEV